MTTNQLPIQRCRYCGSDDLGLGWQHGEGIVTFKKHGILGNRMRCLICRRCGAVLSNGWRSPTGSCPSDRPRRSCDANQR